MTNDEHKCKRSLGEGGGVEKKKILFSETDTESAVWFFLQLK